MKHTLINADVLDGLKSLGSESVDCVITSPPYWGLRKYGTNPVVVGGDPDCKHEFDVKEKKSQHGNWKEKYAGKYAERPSMKGYDALYARWRKPSTEGVCVKCGAWKGELGLETTMEAYLDNLMAWVKEAWRVLKPTGSFVLNIGDCYYGSGGSSGTSTIVPTQGRKDQPRNIKNKYGDFYKPKQFLSVSSFAYCRIISETGFVCRNEALWCKPNVPSPIRSRLKHSHEKLFWFVKDADEYYFNPKPWMKEITNSSIKRSMRAVLSTRVQGAFSKNDYSEEPRQVGMRPNQRKEGRELNYPDDKQTIEHSWRVVPVGERQKGFELHGRQEQVHVAPFPEALVKPWVESLCPKQVCVECGKPVIINRKLTKNTPSRGGTLGLVGGQRVRERIGRDCDYYVSAEYESTEQPSCSCNAGFTAGVVLDPFVGSGTVSKVARDLGFNSVGIDLDKEALEYAKKRVNWGNGVDGHEYEFKELRGYG